MTSIPSLGVLAETLRHLRARQIGYQIRNRFLPRPHAKALSLRWAVSQPVLRVHRDPDRRQFDGLTRFRFNNEERSFSGWNDPEARKLWLYNLHYMAWIFDLDAGRETWMRRWMAENPPGFGTGWEPYPISLRLFYWCKHFAQSGTKPDADILASMGMQAGWLLNNLEFHLDANHLLENLLALTMVGFHLDGAEPSAIKARQRISDLMAEELNAQFMADGGHYELSPMYHAILLERLLELIDSWPIENDPFPGLQGRIRETALNALAWLDTMSVGGRYSLFNDSCYDAGPDAGRLLADGARLLGFSPLLPRARKGEGDPRVDQPITLRALKASGYYRAEAGPATLLFDAGSLGPDHQMGHAQGDMLSFCLWLRDVPVLVHPGNYEYVGGAMRDYCRSTAAHNTLTIEGYEQADWWASHRVGWRGRTQEAEADCDLVTGNIRLRGVHNGYSRLPGRPMHERHMQMTTKSLTVRDRLTSAPRKPCAAHFHFHPDCRIESDGSGYRIHSSGGVLRMSSEAPISLSEGWHCPEFGLRMRNPVLSVSGPWTGFATTLSFSD